MEQRPLRPGGPLVRRTPLERRAPLDRVTHLSAVAPGLGERLRGMSEASSAQRARVVGAPCLACGSSGGVDPAHLVPRSRGGCDDPDCVVALCRLCHRAFDDGRLDLLPFLEPRHRSELAHALSHLGLIELLERLTAERWAPESRRAA